MRLTSALLALLIASLPAARADDPVERVLKQAPDDTALIVLLPGLDQFATGLAAFGKAAEIDDLARISHEDLLEPLIEAGFPPRFLEALDTKGPFALTMRPGAGEPLYIVPVAEPGAFGRETLEELQITIREAGGETLVRLKDGCLLVGTRDEDIDAATSSTGKLFERFRQSTTGLMTDANVVLYVNVPDWKPVLHNGIQMFENLIQMSIEMAQPPESARQFWTYVFQGLRVVADEARVLVAAVRVDGEGIRLHDRASFQADGKVAGYLKHVLPAEGNPLRGLPAGRTIMAFGCEWETDGEVSTLSERMFQTVVASPRVRDKIDAETCEEASKAAAALYRQLSGYNFAVLEPPGQDGFMLVSGLYLTPDVSSTRKQMETMFKLNSRCMGIVFGDMPMELEHRQDKIGEVDVDVYEFRFDAVDQVAELIESMYGKRPALFLVPQKEWLYYAMGAPLAARQQIADVLAGDSTPLVGDARFAAATKQISPSPHCCFYADATKLVMFGVRMAEQTGTPLPAVKFPANGPVYVAFGAYLKTDSVSTELFVPADAVRYVVQVARSASDEPR